MRKCFAVLSLVGLGYLFSATPSLAAGLSGPVVDCQKGGGQLTQRWSASQLRQALATMPADIREYSDCYDVIQQALLAKIGKLKGGGTSGGGGSLLPVWLLVVLIVLVLGAVGFGIAAFRGRGRDRAP